MSAQSDIAWYKGLAIKKKWKKEKWDTGAAQDCCMLPRKDDIKYKHSPKLMDVIINYEKDALQMLHEGHMKQDKNINERAVQHCWVQRLRNKKKAKKKRDTGAAQNCRMLPRKDDVKCGRCPELMDVISVQTMSYRETKIQSCANLPSHRHLSCRNSRWGQYTVAQVTSATSWLPDDRESDQRGNVMHARWGESHWSVKRSPWRRNTIGDMHRFCGRRWETQKKNISWQKT